MNNILCEVQEITPSKAAEILLLRRNQGKIDHRQVAIYADDMQNKRWKLNGEPIIISSSGTLLSGRLRMAACIQSKSSFKSLIIKNIPDERYETIDALRRRQMLDVMSIRKEPHGRALSAALNVLWRYAHDDCLNQSRKVSIQASLDILEKNPDVRASIALTKDLTPLFPHGMTAATHYLFCCVDPERAGQFFSKLAEEKIEDASPVGLLRKQFENIAGSGGRRLQPMLIGLMIKAWEAFRSGKPMLQLRFAPGIDSFPKITNLPTNLAIAGLSSDQNQSSISKSKSPNLQDIKTKIEKITPERAREILEQNAGNRGIAKAVVAKYARDMSNGNWNLNGQTIKIGKTGRLLDGQHRCAACVKANVTFEAVVISGLDESVFDTFDLGARRGLSDILKDKGETYTATLAASLRQLWMIQNGSVQDRALSPTVNEMLDTLDRNPKMRESVKLSNKLKDIIATSFGCALHYLFDQVDPALADKFMDRLADGSDLSSDSPILKLRNILIRDRGSKSKKMLDHDKIAITIKAWNAFYSGRPISTLKWQNAGARIEAFPKISGLNLQYYEEAA
jgi:hypothetical protein